METIHRAVHAAAPLTWRQVKVLHRNAATKKTEVGFNVACETAAHREHHVACTDREGWRHVGPDLACKLGGDVAPAVRGAFRLNEPAGLTVGNGDTV